MSSQGSQSRSSSRGNQRSPSPKKQPKPNKLFVTNLDSSVNPRELEEELKGMFNKFGEITTLVVKRAHNNEYSFAFVDYKEGDDATEAMKELNGVKVAGKEMKVELQDNSRRRKATTQFSSNPRSGGLQCFKCGKIGHFARECRSNGPEQRRGRSRSKERDRKKKKSHRHRSESSESAHAKKKDKKKHKSHKKHKKSKKKHYSSDSSDSD